ncbi:MAG: hypothetical protein JWM88_1513 [Verrucomicrobia bacterium]|nr:hypothetical protein [Verrucomicrobiota bacterium]
MRSTLVIRAVLWGWLFAALLVGRFLLLQRLPMPAVQGILAALTVALLAAYRLSRNFHSWLVAIDLRWIVLLHVSRFVGFYFIVLYRRGELPFAFAVPGGLGDIVVATLALGLVAIPMPAPMRLRAISIWNVVGLLDILMVVFTAGRLGFADSGSMRALTYLPLSLLPTFLVPLIIASHVLIFARVRASDGAQLN